MKKEQRPVKEQERAKEEEEKTANAGRRKKGHQKKRPLEEVTPEVEVDTAIVEKLLNKEATASELEK